MNERFISTPIPIGTETKSVSYKEPTLRESLVGKRGKLPKQQTKIARMINYLDLTILEKRQLFFYHLWHESLSLAPIKEFIEIREDPISFIVDPVIQSERLTNAYADFYLRYEGKTKKQTSPEERMEEILPLRGLYPISEISKRTGYSENYIKSVFKRAIKRGIIKRLDKIESAKINPNWKLHRKIREGVEKLRNQDRKYTEQEIADILSNDFNYPITKQQVKRQIRMLLKEGKIKRRINQAK